MKCKECGKEMGPKPGKSRCRDCRQMIQKERADRIAALPWYIPHEEGADMNETGEKRIYPAYDLEASMVLGRSHRRGSRS